MLQQLRLPLLLRTSLLVRPSQASSTALVGGAVVGLRDRLRELWPLPLRPRCSSPPIPAASLHTRKETEHTISITGHDDLHPKIGSLATDIVDPPASAP